MYWVWYYCPTKSGWIQGQEPYYSFDQAVKWAQILNRGYGSQVTDYTGQVVYSL